MDKGRARPAAGPQYSNAIMSLLREWDSTAARPAALSPRPAQLPQAPSVNAAPAATAAAALAAPVPLPPAAAAPPMPLSSDDEQSSTQPLPPAAAAPPVRPSPAAPSFSSPRGRSFASPPPAAKADVFAFDDDTGGSPPTRAADGGERKDDDEYVPPSRTRTEPAAPNLGRYGLRRRVDSPNYVAQAQDLVADFVAELGGEDGANAYPLRGGLSGLALLHARPGAKRSRAEARAFGRK